MELLRDRKSFWQKRQLFGCARLQGRKAKRDIEEVRGIKGERDQETTRSEMVMDVENYFWSLY